MSQIDEAVITRLRYHILNRLGPDHQTFVAQACGINEGVLSQYCNGIRAIPAGHLERLSECLQVPCSELVGYTELDEIGA